MAWYEVEYFCGHEDRIQIYGKLSNREWIKKAEERKLCPDCWKAEKEREIEKENEEAARVAKEIGLPELLGTPKQIAWATTLRQKMIDRFKIASKEMGKQPDHLFKDLIKISDPDNISMVPEGTTSIEAIEVIHDFIIKNRESASYYIERREKPVYEYLIEEWQNAMKSDEKLYEEEILKDIQMESVVFPQDRITEAIAEITFDQSEVSVKFEKNDDFIELVKAERYIWDWEGRIWYRNITITNGNSTDRAAELGNKLLNAGFPIRILDPQVREQAINGEFEAECTRWIVKRSNDIDHVYIKWLKEDDLYDQVKSLPGAWWIRRIGMRVSVQHYREIEEFASLYDFKMSPGAVKLVDTYKKSLVSAQVVKPATPPKHEGKDGLQELLDSEVEILDDLIDD